VTTHVSAPPRRGRPRDERIDDQLADVALDLLAEGGFERFSVETVAQRVGVAKTTVYRRFASRHDLLVGALECLAKETPAAPPPGPLRERLVSFLAPIRHRRPDSRYRRVLMHAATEGAAHPELAGLVEGLVLAPRRQALRDVLSDGMAAGELPNDLDLDVALAVLVGPMLYLGSWGSSPRMARVTVEQVVDTVLSGLTRATGS
jgi:AcrR family transcriptional regulator